ncbi:F-box domain protein [Cooperia oncophora]
MNLVPSSDFLSTLLDNMDTLTAPSFSPFLISQEDNDIQFSPLLNLPTSVLDRIVSYIPLKVRTLMVARVCRVLRDCVYRSITSVAFYKTQLDELSDTRIKYFLSIHGKQINAINFDLFRSVEDEACTQWSWRQSVITAVKMCSNLRELDILVCKRHRLRDTDLLTIFRQCPQLETLCIDAQYLSGHCFQVVPMGLKRLELEMCLRMNDVSMRCIFNRLKNLEVLYVSELKILKDQIVSSLVSNLRKLRDLSIIGNPDTPNLDLSASALCHLTRLPLLENLCLEGLPAVTDRFLTELGDTTNNAAARNITSLSLAFCYNFSSAGLQRLARMPKLDSLNLDGITKRDISSGLLKVAEEGRLMRLLLAEGTNVSCDALKEIVRLSTHLRLLDISNNDVLADWAAANALVAQWAASKRPSLTILTNNHMPWAMIRLPTPCSIWTPPPVNVCHLHRSLVASTEIIPGSVLSYDNSSQLPQGLLLPRLRRGNRYRLLCSLRPPLQEDSDDQKENSCSPPQRYQRGKGKSPKSPGNVSSISPIPSVPVSPPLFANVQNASPVGTGGVMSPELASYFSNCAPLDMSPTALSELCAGSYLAPDFNQLMPSDMSLEAMMMWLSANQMYDPSTLSLTDPMSILTTGSAGAPRPPVEIPQQPHFNYTRGSRAKRRSNPQTQPSPKSSTPSKFFSPKSSTPSKPFSPKSYTPSKSFSPKPSTPPVSLSQKTPPQPVSFTSADFPPLK